MTRQHHRRLGSDHQRHRRLGISPCFKLGLMAANLAIIDATRDQPKVHVIDFDVDHGGQYAALIHAVAVGGTLQPIEETRERLFPNLSADQVHFFSCSHIFPPESILPITVACGPSGMTFDFSYNSRGSSCGRL